MKRTLIYAATFALATTALIYAGYATAKTNDGRVPNVDNNVQVSPSRWRLVKHTFQLHIPKKNKALSQLIIDVPSTVVVSNDIEILNENGQKININISTTGRKITIAFPEPVISNTKLNINLNKVKQSIQGSDSLYHFSAKVLGSDVEIPVGVARFPTF